MLAYVVIVWLAWYWFLEYHDHRTPEERARHQAEEDEAQAAYLREWRRTHRKPMFNEADKVFLKRMRELVPDMGQGPPMLFVDWATIQRAYRVRPGGFVFVSGPYGEVSQYFRIRNWERLPFMFHDRHIYRKPR